MGALVDVETTMRTVARDGYALVEGVLAGDALEAARDTLEHAADHDRSIGRAYEHTGGNQRVWALLNRGRAFVEMAEHPLAMACCRQVLGERFLLSNISANITGAGGGAMVLHADQGYVHEPWPEWPVALNVAWLLSDFTEANGATRFVPGSHLLNRSPRADEMRAATAPIEGPAGSVLVLDSRTWHQNGPNHSGERRLGVFAYYCRPFIRTQEHWAESLDPRVLADASPQLLELLGRHHYRSLGIVGGMPLDEPRF